MVWDSFPPVLGKQVNNITQARKTIPQNFRSISFHIPGFAENSMSLLLIPNQNTSGSRGSMVK